MNVFQRFERWMHELVEGRMISMLGGRLQPADLARRLAQHMEDQRRISAGRVLAPNSFRVFLSPSTLAGFGSFEQGLEDELASFLIARAEEAGLSFVGRVRVTLLADPDLKGDRCRIASDLVDRRGVIMGDPAMTSPLKSADLGEDGPPAMVLVVGSRSVPLAPRPSLTLGRALGNDIVMDDPSVSRRHALLSRRGGSWLLEDQGSTHGCFVNGRRVQAAMLRPGDNLQLGGVMMRLQLVADLAGSGG
ncbi:MAG: FhaA domain-containing protein [Anaerolineae bacterium]|nr:DUF3662 domain-containing protein [Ardenticatenia bacterium]HQZ70839.1 DUF3662 and FHA domain-containing protein [Anaerolineae bacterium]